MLKIAFVCTGNSARSQMAEAFAKKLSRELGLEIEVFSAGSNPERGIHPLTKKVMEEVGLSLEGQYPKDLSAISFSEMDLVITLCDSARDSCPYLPGIKREHWDLEDPAKAPLEKQIEVFRRVRGLIEEKVRNLLVGLKEGKV